MSMDNPTPEELRADIERLKDMRREGEQARGEIREIGRTHMPLWQRIQHRKQVNGFGEDFDLSLTPRRAS